MRAEDTAGGNGKKEMCVSAWGLRTAGAAPPFPSWNCSLASWGQGKYRRGIEARSRAGMSRESDGTMRIVYLRV
jgi:hypothetical protein